MRPIERLRKTIKTVRKYYPELPIQQLAIMIEVYASDGITIPELVEKLGMTGASLSRNVQMLSLFMKEEKGRMVKKGYELLTTRPDLYERRRLAVWITDKGKTFIEEILKSINLN